MLPLYEPNDNEAGMKLLEDLTTNAHQVQQQVLEEILTKNAATQYLKGFLNGRSDNQLFKKKVPIVNYEDIKPYIERIANGEPSEIISAQQITELLTRYAIYHVGVGARPSSINLISNVIYFIITQLRNFRRAAEDDAFNSRRIGQEDILL